MIEPRIGETITGPTPSGEVITGTVLDVYYTDGEGVPLRHGPCVVVLTDAGRERPIRLADLG